MSKPNKMIIGQKGVKYGLKLGAGQQKAKPVVRKALGGMFGNESDSEDDVETSIKRQAEKKKADAKVAHEHAQALAADPNAYAYDEVYDEMQDKIRKPIQAEKAARKSQYIESLLEKAKGREKERSIVTERLLGRERAKDDHLYGDKEVFITAAYAKKLEEDKLFLAEEKQREEAAAGFDVTSAGDMSAFYTNLSRNVAFGGKPDPPRRPPGSAAEELSTTGDGGAATETGDAGLHSALSKRAAQKAEEEAGMMDEYTRLRMRAEAAPRGGERREATGTDQGAAGSTPGSGPAEESPPAKEESVPKEKRRNDEVAVESAKERYLARKRARASAGGGS